MANAKRSPPRRPARSRAPARPPRADRPTPAELPELPDAADDDLPGAGVGVADPASIDVGDAADVDPALLLEKLDAIRRKEVERQHRRMEAAAEIAKYRWMIARTTHRLEDGVSKLNFTSHPFQRAIYQDQSLDLIIYGSAQWGKTEFTIVHAASSAGYGLKVLWVLSKYEKRNKFVSGRLDPCFTSVGMYREMIEAARGRGGNADSTQMKHFGPGSMNLIAATSDKDFTTYPADTCIVDEHQECDLNNVKLVDDRMSGSWFGGLVRLGHPTVSGNEENGNLDWLYQNSNQQVWKVPCDTCGKSQVITWWNHVVYEERNRSAVLSVRPRDGEWRPGGRNDIRPVCEECHRPMDRLSDAGRWVALKPENVLRSGYKLSNLYNANVRLDKLFDRYKASRHSARDTAEFVNKQLGECWDMDGSKITEPILAACATGEASGVVPYKFIPSRLFNWRAQ